MGARIEDLISEIEPVIVTKEVTPSLVGKRRAITLYIDQGSSQSFDGFVTALTSPKIVSRLSHDFKISGCSIFHVADFKPVGRGYALDTQFINCKQNPKLQVSFSGLLKSSSEGFRGDVIVTHPGGALSQFWDIVYEE